MEKSEKCKISANKNRPTMLSILVTSDIVGVIIGRGGSTINEIIEQTSVRINVNTNYIAGCSEKVITIYGTPENSTLACRKILEVMQQKATYSNENDMVLRILIYDNLNDLVNGEEDNTIKNIMSDTETKINVTRIIDITIDNINYKSVCTVKGPIENISKAESLISAKLRQCYEKYLQQVILNIDPVTEMRNLSEIRLPCFSYGGPGATPVFRNRQTESLLCILVHSDVIGLIIGRGGSKVKEIMEQTSVKISVKKNNIVGNLEKPIAIYGTPENCTNGCRKILEVMQQKAIYSNENNTILRILIHDNLIGLIIGEEGNTIRNIMCVTETKINVTRIIDITIDNINYKSVCTVKGPIENISKAESLISAKLRQSYEKYLQQVIGCQLNIDPVTEMRNLSEIRLPCFSYGGPGATPVIKNSQTESLLCILVHCDWVHAIIGNRGSTIKKITQQTSAWVHVWPKGNLVEQAIIIKGNPENCTNACFKILKVLQENMTNTCSDVILKMLIPDNLIGIIIEEEGNTIWKIMSETETKINVSSMTVTTINNFNYKSICTIKGSIKNVSKAEVQISAKLRQSIEHFIQSMDIKVKPDLEMNNLYEIEHTQVLHVGSNTIPSIENREFTLRILVQNNMIPVIIGKLGSTIKEITQQTGARIHVNKKDSEGSTEKAITIKGIPENCTNACRKILDVMKKKKAFSNESDVILKILVHNNHIGVIIGEEGNNIRKIMSETDTNIVVPSITDITIDSFNKERVFTVEGSAGNVSKAEAQISAKIRQCFKNISSEHVNVTNQSKLVSNVKPNTIPMQCPAMENEVPDVPNIDNNDSKHYNLKIVKSEMTNKKYKLIIVGDSNVGKSTIIYRFCKGVYKETIKTTIGLDFNEIFVRFENKTIQLNIWDTAGTEKYQSLAQSYYRGAHGIFIVYDITDVDAAANVKKWIDDVEIYSDPGSVKILIGSKCDDTSNRKISIEEGQNIAKALKIPFFEVSSKTNVHLDKLFYTMVSTINDIQNQTTDIKKKLNHIDVTDKSRLDSDIKPNTTLVQCPKMEKEVPDIDPNIDFEDSEHNKLIRLNRQETNKKFKLIIVGHSNSGKSAIINRFIKGVYSEDIIPTLGIDFYDIFIRFKNEVIQINTWDTAGTEKYQSLAQSYYRGAHGIFIVYDITDVDAAANVKKWIDDVEIYSDPDSVKMLIGSKCDDTSNRKISIEDGQDVANRLRYPFLEVSSKTNVHIDKLFYTMISKIYENQAQSITVQGFQSFTDFIRVENPPSYSKNPEKISSGGCSC